MGLGWNHVTWKANKPPGAMNNTWSALSPVQQGWAALLGYGEASWNEGAAAVAAEGAEEAAAEMPEIQAAHTLHMAAQAAVSAQHEATAHHLATNHLLFFSRSAENMLPARGIPGIGQALEPSKVRNNER